MDPLRLVGRIIPWAIPDAVLQYGSAALRVQNPWGRPFTPPVDGVGSCNVQAQAGNPGEDTQATTGYAAVTLGGMMAVVLSSVFLGALDTTCGARRHYWCADMHSLVGRQAGEPGAPEECTALRGRMNWLNLPVIVEFVVRGAKSAKGQQMGLQTSALEESHVRAFVIRRAEAAEWAAHMAAVLQADVDALEDCPGPKTTKPLGFGRLWVSQFQPVLFKHPLSEGRFVVPAPRTECASRRQASCGGVPATTTLPQAAPRRGVPAAQTAFD